MQISKNNIRIRFPDWKKNIMEKIEIKNWINLTPILLEHKNMWTSSMMKKLMFFISIL